MNKNSTTKAASVTMAAEENTTVSQHDPSFVRLMVAASSEGTSETTSSAMTSIMSSLSTGSTSKTEAPFDAPSFDSASPAYTYMDVEPLICQYAFLPSQNG